jgi:hypothetical protein
MRHRPTLQDLAAFRRLCCFRVRAPQPFKFPRWTVEFYQPNAAALAAIARRQDWQLCFAEVALDWIFANDLDRNDAKRLFDRHHVQLWHRGEIRFYRRTRYTGPRRTRVNIVDYDDQPSKVTGESCLHVEVRITGADTLRRLRIRSVADLISFDHHAFWRRYLRFYDFHASGLGRYILNRQKGTRRRTPLIYRFGRRRSFSYDVDSRAGYHLFNVCRRSVQTLIDESKQLTMLRRYLIPMSAEHLLPSPDINVITSADLTRLPPTGCPTTTFLANSSASTIEHAIQSCNQTVVTDSSIDKPGKIPTPKWR